MGSTQRLQSASSASVDIAVYINQQGHLQKDRNQGRVKNKARAQERMAAVALNRAAIWFHRPHPSSAFHSNCHAEIGMPAAMEHARWMGPVGPGGCIREQAESKAAWGWAARVQYFQCARRREHGFEVGLCGLEEEQEVQFSAFLLETD